jgi:hypothetical protein
VIVRAKVARVQEDGARHRPTLCDVRRSDLRAAAAGAAAATAWALLEPVDQRLFRCDYSDVAVLGKLVTRGDRWRMAGMAVHGANGAVFGLAFARLRRRHPRDPRRLALGMALAEHAGLYPLCALIDRHHPARGSEGIPPLLTNGRAFAQATVRHALFGVLLGRLAGPEPRDRALPRG